MQSTFSAEVLGHVGQPSQLKQFASGTYLTFTIAHNEQWEKDGQQVQRTTWINCLYKVKVDSKLKLEKGTVVLVKGALNTKLFRRDDGTQDVSVNINVYQLNIIGKIEKRNETEKAIAQDQTALEGATANAGGFDDLPF